jgi:glycosyl hydrolase family 25
MWLQPDVSHWQGHHTREDMAQAATVASSILFKATQGDSFVDNEFESNAKAANAVGLPWGAYHFVDTVDEGDGVAQAEHFWRVANSVPNLAFVMIDWERAWRPLAKDLADRLLELADVPVGDYIGSHARSQGGQLPRMAFHMVPQYGPAQLDPDYETDPTSAWQYTNGETNGTDWPSSVPGIGKCDMSAVFRPGDFGFGGDMAISDEDVQKIVKAIRKTELRADGLIAEQAWRDANMTRAAVAVLAGNLANWDDEVIAQLQTALQDALGEMELGDLSVNEVAETVAQKIAERMSG